MGKSVLALLLGCASVILAGDVLSFEIASFDLPVMAMPFRRREASISSGPHPYGDTDTLAQVPSSGASGLDFAPVDPLGCGGNCGFDVLSMAPGWVSFAGLGPLGNMVAVKLQGADNYLIYGHLYDFDVRLTERYFQGLFWVDQGTRLGRSGGTGASGRREWPVHLHVELRDGDTCSSGRLCINATDIAGNKIRGLGGNPASWIGQEIDGYKVYPYCTDPGCGIIYNYDGILTRQHWGEGEPELYADFSYIDVDASSQRQNILRQGVYVFGVPQDTDCDGISDCEQEFLLPDELRSEVLFAGRGIIGGGAVLDSTNEVNPHLPETDPPFEPPTEIQPSSTAGELVGAWETFDEESNQFTVVFCPNGDLKIMIQGFPIVIGGEYVLDEDRLTVRVDDVNLTSDVQGTAGFVPGGENSTTSGLRFEEEGHVAILERDDGGTDTLVRLQDTLGIYCPELSDARTTGSVSSDVLTGSWRYADESSEPSITITFCPDGIMLMSLPTETPGYIALVEMVYSIDGSEIEATPRRIRVIAESTGDLFLVQELGNDVESGTLGFSFRGDLLVIESDDGAQELVRFETNARCP